MSFNHFWSSLSTWPCRPALSRSVDLPVDQPCRPPCRPALSTCSVDRPVDWPSLNTLSTTPIEGPVDRPCRPPLRSSHISHMSCESEWRHSFVFFLICFLSKICLCRLPSAASLTISRGRCCPPWPSHTHWKQICDTTLAQQPFELLRRASDVGRFSAADVAPTRRAVAIVPKAACRLSPNRQAIVYRMSPAEYLSARFGDEPRLSQTLKHQSIYKRRSVQGFRTSRCNAL